MVMVSVGSFKSNLMLIVFRSCFICSIHVMVGLPGGLFTFLMHSVSDFLAGMLGWSRMR